MRHLSFGHISFPPLNIHILGIYSTQLVSTKIALHVQTYIDIVYSYIFIPPKRQLKIVKSIPRDVSEQSPVTFSRSSNINMHTSAIMSFIKDTACTTVRKLTSRSYFSPPTDIKSWQKDCIPLAKVIFMPLLLKDYHHEKSDLNFIIFLASNDVHHLNTPHHHILK